MITDSAATGQHVQCVVHVRFIVILKSHLCL